MLEEDVDMDEIPAEDIEYDESEVEGAGPRRPITPIDRPQKRSIAQTGTSDVPSQYQHQEKYIRVVGRLFDYFMVMTNSAD